MATSSPGHPGRRTSRVLDGCGVLGHVGRGGAMSIDMARWTCPGRGGRTSARPPARTSANGGGHRPHGDRGPDPDSDGGHRCPWVDMASAHRPAGALASSSAAMASSLSGRPVARPVMSAPMSTTPWCPDPRMSKLMSAQGRTSVQLDVNLRVRTDVRSGWTSGQFDVHPGCPPPGYGSMSARTWPDVHPRTSPISTPDMLRAWLRIWGSMSRAWSRPRWPGQGAWPRRGAAARGPWRRQGASPASPWPGQPRSRRPGTQH